MSAPRLALLAAGWLGLQAAALAGGSVFESRPVGPFTRIEHGGPADLVFTHGAHHAVVIEAEPALQSRIQVVVRDGVLAFDYGREPLETHAPLRFHVSAPTLDALSIAGSGDAALTRIQGPAFVLDARGSGNVRLEAIEADRLSIDHAGAGDVVAEGRCQDLEVSTTTSGDLDLNHLSCQHGRIRLAGSGDVGARISTRLEVDLSGSGDLTVIGHPSVSEHHDGVGELRLMADH